eukprot:m.1573121 g.1573121  ORF g.1573121 m.1573121 type:complete len:144 (-) comp25304_c0_seq4:8409-8840(-)
MTIFTKRSIPTIPFVLPPILCCSLQAFVKKVLLDSRFARVKAVRQFVHAIDADTISRTPSESNLSLSGSVSGAGSVSEPLSRRASMSSLHETHTPVSSTPPADVPVAPGLTHADIMSNLVSVQKGGGNRKARRRSSGFAPKTL